jgi:hypothetical protein
MMRYNPIWEDLRLSEVRCGQVIGSAAAPRALEEDEESIWLASVPMPGLSGQGSLYGDYPRPRHTRACEPPTRDR